MDLIRFAALMSVPAAFALGRLSFAQLLVVSVVVAAADIAFNAASGAYLKALVPPEDLLVANGRFESTTWTATVARAAARRGRDRAVRPGDDRGGRRGQLPALGAGHPRDRRRRSRAPREPAHRGCGPATCSTGWRYILAHPALRPLFFNTVAGQRPDHGHRSRCSPCSCSADLGFAPWQYGLAFAAPCVGGLIGSRLARRLVARFGRHRVMLTAGTLRACWPVGLAFVRPGVAGLVLVIAVELGLITCMRRVQPGVRHLPARTDRRPTASPAPCPRGRSPAAPPSRP